MAKEIEQKFLDVIQALNEDGNHCIDIGDLDGDPFMIVDEWDTVAEITGRLNGFEGLKNHFGGYRGESLDDQIGKLKMDLAVTPADHYGSISRINREIAAIESVKAYRAHLEANGIEDPAKIEDFIEFGFSDEHSMCPCCYKNVVRTSPDSYSWTPPYFSEDQGYICTECVEGGDLDDEMLESYKNEEKSIPEDFDIDRLGLVQINEDSFQNGWYGGQCDTPRPIIDALNEADIDVWFKVYPRQFDLSFDVYVKAEHEDRAKQILAGTNVEADRDPADVLKAGLQAASEGMSRLPEGEGVKYASINADGTADVRLVSNEEFIDGIKRK